MPKKVGSSMKKIAKKTAAKKNVKTAVKNTAVKKAKAKPVAKKMVGAKKVATKSTKKPLPKSTAMKPKSLKKPAVRRKKVSAIPKGYNSITPYLIVNNAAKAADFYKTVFSAKEGIRMDGPEGKICHLELKIGDAKIMLADEMPERGAKSPENYGGCAVSICLYTKDVDATIKTAISAGAKLIRPVENMFYGDRAGAVQDPFGHIWHVATHIEDVSPAMQKKRAMEQFAKKA